MIGNIKIHKSNTLASYNFLLANHDFDIRQHKYYFVWINGLGYGILEYWVYKTISNIYKIFLLFKYNNIWVITD
jgi:hypothetical protein